MRKIVAWRGGSGEKAVRKAWRKSAAFVAIQGGVTAAMVQCAGVFSIGSAAAPIFRNFFGVAFWICGGGGGSRRMFVTTARNKKKVTERRNDSLVTSSRYFI